MPSVEVRGVVKTYSNIQALKGVDLKVKAGEYLSIVGPSGCGKTTLIKVIAGIVQPDKGEVTIGNRNVSDLAVEDRNLGYVFQEIALFPHMSSYDNVSYGLMVRGKSPEDRSSEVKQMLGMMALEEYASYYPNELSGGARQKTAIGRALATGSNLLLLDEPLGLLDLKVRTVLRYELQKLVKDLHLTAIHVTHDQEEALSISDSVVIMKAGNIVEVGEPKELYLHPKELFTAKFLGEATFMEGIVKKEGKTITVDVNGLTLKAQNNGGKLGLGDRCVLAIRPEFVEIRNGKKTGSNKCHGRIRIAGFLGDAYRYEVDADNGVTVIVKKPIVENEPDLKVGDEVTIYMAQKHILTFRHPGGDLEKELSIE